MNGLRFVVRDFINRQLENDASLLTQTIMLSGKRIIVLMPDILPTLLLFDIEIGSDGLIDDIVISDKEIEQNDNN